MSVIVGALALSTDAARAQVSQMEQTPVLCPIADDPQPLALGRNVLGSRACFGCHLQGTASFNAVDPEVVRIVGAEFLRRAVHDNWVLGNEWRTWSAEDRHAQAYTTLLSRRSRRMGEILGVKDIHRDARCLACHSSVPAAAIERDGNLVSAAYFAADRIDERIALGVNCEACHGAAGAAPAGELPGWIDVHVASQTWRHRAPGEKQSAFGFYDVRSPASRARMCLSCHLGDARQGRLVTHAMYAAGHPPLPGFEQKSFADMMPPHWRDLGSRDEAEPQAADPATLRGKKPLAITADFLTNTADPYFQNLRDNRPEYFRSIAANYDEAFAATRSLAVGALVAWTKNAELSRALASDDEYPLLDRDDRWPELAQFECSACHHELRTANWHADRPLAGRPGRPLLRDWPAPLAGAVVRALEPESAVAFNQHRRQIAAAAVSQPFGDRAALDASLSAAAESMNELTAAVESRGFTRADAESLLRETAAAGAAEPLDYDAARQLVWAAGELLDELDPNETWTPPREALAALRDRFILDLASRDVRRETQQTVPGAGGRVAYEIELAAILPTWANHDAAAVQAAFAGLAEALARNP